MSIQHGILIFTFYFMSSFKKSFSNCAYLKITVQVLYVTRGNPALNHYRASFWGRVSSSELNCFYTYPLRDLSRLTPKEICAFVLLLYLYKFAYLVISSLILLLRNMFGANHFIKKNPNNLGNRQRKSHSFTNHL